MTDTTEDHIAGAGKLIGPDTAAITVPLDLFKRLVGMAGYLAEDAFAPNDAQEIIAAARREIEQVEALLASLLE